MNPIKPTPNVSSPLVIVGMSGGVDSSVAAHLLLEAGYRVEGLFMVNWEDDDSYCTAAEDFQDARAVCANLGIGLHRANFAAEYRARVFRHFLDEYRAGRTPNPDILCNREIKFKAFFDYAMRLGADFIATGHYARLRHDERGTHLLCAADRAKDQTYFLHAVPSEALARTLFPLGELSKDEVRQLAEDAGFGNFDKKDSTGICFIGERDFADFLSRYLPAQPGNIFSVDGVHLGRHQGLMFHTLGQRKGLGIGGQRHADERPWYVVDKDLGSNSLIVGQGHDHPRLLSSALLSESAYWISGQSPVLPLRCKAKVRYRQSAQSCTVYPISDGLRVVFDDSQWAVTPGQSVVFYTGEECLGGAVIRERLATSSECSERPAVHEAKA